MVHTNYNAAAGKDLIKCMTRTGLCPVAISKKTAGLEGQTVQHRDVVRIMSGDISFLDDGRSIVQIAEVLGETAEERIDLAIKVLKRARFIN